MDGTIKKFKLIFYAPIFKGALLQQNDASLSTHYTIYGGLHEILVLE